MTNITLPPPVELVAGQRVRFVAAHPQDYSQEWVPLVRASSHADAGRLTVGYKGCGMPGEEVTASAIGLRQEFVYAGLRDQLTRDGSRLAPQLALHVVRDSIGMLVVAAPLLGTGDHEVTSTIAREAARIAWTDMSYPVGVLLLHPGGLGSPNPVAESYTWLPPNGELVQLP